MVQHHDGDYREVLDVLLVSYRPVLAGTDILAGKECICGYEALYWIGRLAEARDYMWIILVEGAVLDIYVFQSYS